MDSCLCQPVRVNWYPEDILYCFCCDRNYGSLLAIIRGPKQLECARCRSSGVRTQRLRPCKAAVKFQIKKQVEWGDKLCLVGNHKVLGRWEADNGVELRWNDGDVWTANVKLPDNAKVEYKVVNIKGLGDPEWERGDNRSLSVGSEPVDVQLKWGKTDNGAVAPGGYEPRQLNADSDAKVGSDTSEAWSSSYESDSGEGSSDALPQNKWQGKEVRFMTENQHSKERSGVWNTDGLHGAVLDLVTSDEHSASWLQKLEVAKEILVEKSTDMRPQLDAVASVYIYLQWIMTGSIVCVEGGGHYRPNRHAELAKVMFRSLEWVSGDNSRPDVERWTARRMQSKLPSFSESFTASVPLTRIRDIAHRNDIPSDLKREIKHTLQNKLHRNAGPEDLVATEAMLERITAPGTDYSHDFVNEFRVFTDELRDFFNAGTLVQILDGVRPALDDSGRATLGQFLEVKRKMEHGGSEEEIADCMHQLTSVRTMLVAGLASGLRNDAPDNAMAMRQKWRLAELRCEDYAFILLSRYINAIAGSGTLAALRSGDEASWARPLGALVLALRHCGLSGWMAGECLAIDEDIGCWQKLGASASNENTLRLKATLERVQRLTASFADAQLDAFAERASKLGGSLGIPREVQNVFTEAEIRANVAFQLSKLNTDLLQACREQLGMGDYDGIVFGEATGELVEVESIQPGQKHAGGRPCVLLVQSATGDEEVSTAGDNIRGVVLCQELPHLSHLGVRSRQERVPLATCTSQSAINSTLKPLVGKPVKLTVSSESVSLAAHSGEVSAEDNGAVGQDSAPVATPQYNGSGGVSRVESVVVIPMSDAKMENAGAKAQVCGALAALSDVLFEVPAGTVLPFGCMEAAIKQAAVSEEFEALLSKLESAKVGDELDSACASIQALIRDHCKPAPEVAAKAVAKIGGTGIAIARSSANVEDLAGLSGAGLYESIPNLRVGDLEGVAAGIADVWASLYSRRAVLSRRTAGIPQRDACMAVLVQEMLAPELSYVLHTRDPMVASESAAGSVYAEIAPGMGETLASGTEGSAWRMSVGSEPGDVTMRAFANFSQAYMPVLGSQGQLVPGNSIYGSQDDGETQEAGMVRQRTVAYSQHYLSKDEDKRKSLAARLYKIGKFLEDEMGSPQDVEGAVLGDSMYVVQSRPQP